MSKLYLQRHLKSQWNLDDRFAGWTDGPLTKDSNAVAKEIAKEISQIKFDKVYSSALFRNMDTIAKIFEFVSGRYPIFVHMDGGKMQKWGNYTNPNPSPNEVIVYVTEKLNERYYGKLQGLNKEETMEKYGEEKVHLWRRSYDVVPPRGESLKDVCKRVNPFYKKHIEKDLKEGRDVLIVGSHNSLRAIVKYLENIPKEKIADLELPFGALVKYEFDGKKYLPLQ